MLDARLEWSIGPQNHYGFTPPLDDRGATVYELAALLSLLCLSLFRGPILPTVS